MEPETQSSAESAISQEQPFDSAVGQQTGGGGSGVHSTPIEDLDRNLPEVGADEANKSGVYDTAGDRHDHG